MTYIVGGHAMKKNVLLLFKQFHENFRFRTPRCKKLSHFLDIKNDALMHR